MIFMCCNLSQSFHVQYGRVLKRTVQPTYFFLRSFLTRTEESSHTFTHFTSAIMIRLIVLGESNFSFFILPVIFTHSLLRPNYRYLS